MPDLDALPRRLLVAHADPRAFAPMTRAILARMGYRIVVAEELGSLPPELVADPALLLVEDRLLGELDAAWSGHAGTPPAPIVLLTGRKGIATRDPRVVGAVRKPAGLHEIYRLVQQILEETPRATPRIPTRLEARCRSGDEEWDTSVLSLSENGCLLRSERPLPLGARVDLTFELPEAGRVETEAEVAYQLISELGLVFHATAPAARDAIVSFVTAELAAA